jgi:hypothetical protein
VDQPIYAGTPHKIPHSETRSLWPAACVVAYQSMKMYVWHYGPHEEGLPLAEPRVPGENYDITFSTERGGLLMNDIVSAQYELEALTRMRVHSGKHFCHFELEEEEGVFAIVCKEHTQITQDGVTFDSSWIDGQVARFTDKREIWAVRVASIEKEIAAAESAHEDMLKTRPDDRPGHAHSRAYINALKRTQQQLRGHPER